LKSGVVLDSSMLVGGMDEADVGSDDSMEWGAGFSELGYGFPELE
jgi:hypothetical protein